MRAAFLLLLTVIVFPSDVRAQRADVLRAQSVDLIAVGGTIIDEATGAVLEGAKISAIGMPLGTVSSNDGRYLIRGLANENQVIRASLDGYIPEARELWVCRPVVYPGGTCTPPPATVHELRFYLRRAPMPALAQ